MREREVKLKSGRAEEASVPDASRHLLGMRSLVANRLYDAQGNFVGKLEEVILDVRSGCVQHVVVAVGGIMGIGRRRLAVPWSALVPDADYRRCVIDVAQMRLTAVQVSDVDPWLRRAPSPRAGDETFFRRTRALGTGD
jgi:sporulation protein YlmC with PRC-barrel domain